MLNKARTKEQQFLTTAKLSQLLEQINLRLPAITVISTAVFQFIGQLFSLWRGQIYAVFHCKAAVNLLFHENLKLKFM
jgi:hypothetical protein